MLAISEGDVTTVRLWKTADITSDGIPIQHEASSRSTMTDADSIFNVGTGIPTALVSLPLRYMHSVVEMADFQDVEQVVALLTAFARSIRAGDRFTVEI